MQIDPNLAFGIFSFLFLQLVALCCFTWRLGSAVARMECAITKNSDQVVETKNSVAETRQELRHHTEEEEKQFRDLLVRQTVFDGRLRALEEHR